MIKKDVSIQAVRILAMFSIILCHLVQQLNNSTLAKTGQLFNVGVYIFLFLSGWLYGKKEIADVRSWLVGRVKRVLVPMWIFMAFLFSIHFIQGTLKWKYIPIYLTDTQYWCGKIGGGEHLWFISAIFLCYLLTPVFQRLGDKTWIAFLSMIICGGGICYLNHTLGMTILYVSVYGIGYWFKNLDINIRKVYSIILILSALAVRVTSMIYLDGTVLYDCILVYLTHTALAIGLFFLGKQLLKSDSNRIIDWMDSISYFVYITHYMFMVGPARTMGLTENILLNTAVTIALSFCSAAVLQMIYNLVVRGDCR